MGSFLMREKTMKSSAYEEGFVDALDGSGWGSKYPPMTPGYEDYGRGHTDGAETVNEFDSVL